MANPQKEKGHIQISTELWEALTKIRINGEARQVLDLIIRKTYGFNKKVDAISLSQFCLGTGLHKSAVCKGLLKLRAMNLITQKVTRVASSYQFNKDFDTWKPLPKRRQSPKGDSHQKVNNLNPKGDIQYTVTKDSTAKGGGATPTPKNNVNEILAIFNKQINPTLGYANKTQRAAVQALLENPDIGYEKLKNALQVLVSVDRTRPDSKFIPDITTPLQLKIKYAKLRNWAKANL